MPECCPGSPASSRTRRCAVPAMPAAACAIGGCRSGRPAASFPRSRRRRDRSGARYERSTQSGPAVVDGNSGGCTSTSTTSCVPPNRVTEPGRIVVHPAARPTGANENDSVVSPRLTIVSWKTAEVPGTTSMSLRENHAWAAIAATLLAAASPWASIRPQSVTHPGGARTVGETDSRTAFSGS